MYSTSQMTVLDPLRSHVLSLLQLRNRWPGRVSRLIENAWRRLAQEAHTIRADVAEQPVEEIVGPHAQDSVGPILDQPATVIAALIGEKIFDITRARRLTWLMVAYNVAVQRVLADTRAAACKLADHVAWVLADQRATYLRAIGHPPKVDSIDPAEIRKRTGGDHQWWTEQHLVSCQDAAGLRQRIRERGYDPFARSGDRT